MRNHFTMQLEDSSVKFTPDGKVAVVDAIKALSDCEDATRIWQLLKQEQPKFTDLCEGYDFRENQSEAVVDSQGWQQIEDALLDYILSQAAVRQ